MSHKRQVWEAFSQLAQRLLAAAESAPASPQSDLDGMAQELKRLGKTQFKANALQETALEQLRQTVEGLSGGDRARSRQDRLAAQQELLTALLPILDGLESALDSGQRLLDPPDGRDAGWVERQLGREGDPEPAEAHLIRQHDRVLMAAWLDGLRLVRQRLLALLDQGGVEPIVVVGQPFDPYLHQAVGTAQDGTHPPGTVLAEEQRGYTGPLGVLRYAKVIVNRGAQEKAPPESVL